MSSGLHYLYILFTFSRFIPVLKFSGFVSSEYVLPGLVEIRQSYTPPFSSLYVFHLVKI